MGILETFLELGSLQQRSKDFIQVGTRVVVVNADESQLTGQSIIDWRDLNGNNDGSSSRVEDDPNTVEGPLYEDPVYVFTSDVIISMDDVLICPDDPWLVA